MGFMIVSATQKGRQTQNWKVGDIVFERVSSFKYLGNVINEEGRINECVKDNTNREQSICSQSSYAKKQDYKEIC